VKKVVVGLVKLPYKLIVRSRTVEIRRLGIKIRTYENAKVFLGGTAGRGSCHWAADDFKDCAESSEEVTYFSGNNEWPAIAAHGSHIHVIFREVSDSVNMPNAGLAEEILLKFVEELRRRGVVVELEKR
jgi:hypothetical protein